MKFAKKIEIKVTVKDNQFLKECVPYLQRCCRFTTKNDGYLETTELEALIDSDEFIITLNPIEHRNGELTVVDGEFQYFVGLTFNGTSMTGNFWNSYEPYVLLMPSEAFKLIFPNISRDDVESGVNVILNMVFGLKNEEKFKYEIL